MMIVMLVMTLMRTIIKIKITTTVVLVIVAMIVFLYNCLLPVNPLVGLVVKASDSRAAVPGLNSRFLWWGFFWGESCQ